MTKDEIKKGLECCCNDSDFKNACRNCSYLTCPGCNDTLCKDALNLITEQENEINNLKDDYAKLQELFAQYQIASDKEMIAHIKQAKIELLKELIDGYGQDYISHVGLEKYKVWRVLKEIIEELQND